MAPNWPPSMETGRSRRRLSRAYVIRAQGNQVSAGQARVCQALIGQTIPPDLAPRFGGFSWRLRRTRRMRSDMVNLKSGLSMTRRHTSIARSTRPSSGGNLFHLYFKVFFAAI